MIIAELIGIITRVRDNEVEVDFKNNGITCGITCRFPIKLFEDKQELCKYGTSIKYSLILYPNGEIMQVFSNTPSVTSPVHDIEAMNKLDELKRYGFTIRK